MKLDKWHYHEFVDRMAVLIDYFESNIANHPVAKKHFSKRTRIISSLMVGQYGAAVNHPGWKNKK